MESPKAITREHKKGLADECQRFGVERLELFGSAVRDDFDPLTSDYDFIVRFSDKTPGTYADRYFDFASAVEQLLGRSIDLLTERSISNPHFRRQVDATRQLIYAERRPETAS